MDATMSVPLARSRLPGALLAVGILLLTLLTACAGAEDSGHERPRRTDASAKPEPGESSGTHEEHTRSQAERAEQEASKHGRSRAPKTWTHPVLGADISWPQCPRGMGIPQRRSQGQPPPLPSARYVVIGLTNGPAFTPNPCLADQLALVRERGLLASAYAVVSWPAADRPGGAHHDGPYDVATRYGRLRNAGYAQATYNLAVLQRHHFRTPAIWVDVEPYPVFPWSDDLGANAQVVRGAVRAYRDAGLRIGIYSTPSLWRQVVGSLRFGVPEWRAAGHTSRDEALARCAPAWSIQGGRAVLAQWTDGRRDHNTTCPGAARELDRWFHQY
jgi:hypothetical protein